MNQQQFSVHLQPTTSYKGRVIYYQVGGGWVIFGGGGENKKPFGGGAGIINLIRYLVGGVRCVFAFIKSHSPDPTYPNCYCQQYQIPQKKTKPTQINKMSTCIPQVLYPILVK